MNTDMNEYDKTAGCGGKQTDPMEADAQLGAMRRELKALKEELSRQNIITEGMLRAAIGAANRDVRRMVYLNLPAVAVVTLCCGYLNVENGIVSHALAWATVALLAVVLAVNAVVNWISTDDVMRLPLAELQQKLIKRRKRRLIARNVGMALALGWFVWVIVELSHMGDSSALIEGVVIGGIVGVVIGTRKFRRFQRADAELIRQIEDRGED